MFTKIIYNKLISMLTLAGRDPQTIEGALDEFDVYIRQMYNDLTKENWVIEYYIFVLDSSVKVMNAAIDAAINLEEYEWVSALTNRINEISEELESEPDLLNFH